MKVVQSLILILILITTGSTLAGCASFECSIGAGYRKVPPEVSQPILPTRGEMKAMGLTPAQIKLLFDFLLSDSFKVLFPNDNRVDVGAWVEIRAK